MKVTLSTQPAMSSSNACRHVDWRAVVSPWPRSDARHVKRSLFALAGGLLGKSFPSNANDEGQTWLQGHTRNGSNSSFSCFSGSTIKYRSSALNNVAPVYVKGIANRPAI
jgi:hypothetical protein